MPRPKSFDPEAVLCKAMGVFWEKGYDAASISDLTAAMGINRFSLYDTFGDKHTLYIKALDSYFQSVVEPVLERVRAMDSIEDLEAHFVGVVEFHQSRESTPCCMIQKTAVSMASGDDAARDRVQQTRARFREAFEEVLRRLKDKGEIAEDVAVADAAMLLMTMQTGLVSSSAVPLPAEEATAAVRLLIGRLKPAPSVVAR